MGRVYQRGNIWWIDYGYQGQRYRESIGASESLARKVLHKREIEIIEGKFFPNKKRDSVITTGEMVRLFWELHGKNKKGRALKSILKRIEKDFGHVRLDRINVPMLLAFKDRIKNESSVATLNRYLGVFRSMLNRAIEWEKFAGPNPAAKVKQERESPGRLRFLSHEEIRRLLEASHPRLRPVLFCALLTGMRRGEMLSLVWENVDLVQRIIYVLESKSGKPREIPIAEKLMEALRSLQPKESGNIFQIPVITLRKYFDRAVRMAGIKGFRFHDLRHTFASHYIWECRFKDVQK